MEGNVMRKPLGEEMEFFRQYNEVLFNQLEKKILDKETANQHLRISVEEYRLQFENISDVVFMIGTDFNILSISPSVEKLLGYKAEDFIGRPASDLRHIFTSESFERAITNISKMLKNERIPVSIYAFVAKDGTLKHIEIHGSPLIRDGQVAGTISVARDITERKLMEDKLCREEQRFRTFVEHSSDIIVLMNLEGIITYINPAVEKVLGFKPEERIGAKGFELIHPDDMKFLADSFNILARDTNAPVINGEMHLRHKDGNWRTLEAVGSNLVQDNVIEAVIVNYRDITERKRVDEVLREAARDWQITFDAARDAICLLDTEQRILRCNLAMDKMFGVTQKKNIGWHCWDVVHGLTEPIPECPIKRMKSSLVREEMEMQRGDRWFNVIADPILDETSTIRGMVHIMRDITERKQVEDLLKESEKKYRELSIIDDLTQLYKSRHFYAQLEIEIERSNRYGQPLTLLLLNLDKFKKFNDKYGHVEGDYVLSRLGQVVKRCLRDPDSAYRYGGEEFTIMLPMTTSEEGIVTAKRIQTELRKEAFSPVLDKNIYITVSIGLAQYKPMEEMKTFVQRVDKLMYQAKKDGRDRICPDRRYKHSVIVST
jgi:diguanylate cyclase (GGDEF)-like protein/PAS domain S-box-containing protein